jgi:hypothetical protein
MRELDIDLRERNGEMEIWRGRLLGRLIFGSHACSSHAEPIEI